MKCPRPAAPVYKGSLPENFHQILSTKSTPQDPKSHSLRNTEGSTQPNGTPEDRNTLPSPLPSPQGRNTQAGLRRRPARSECLQGNYYQNKPDSQPLLLWHHVPHQAWANNRRRSSGGAPHHPQLLHVPLQGFHLLRTPVTQEVLKDKGEQTGRGDGCDGSGGEQWSTQGTRRTTEDTCFVSIINKAAFRFESWSFEPSIPGFLSCGTVNIRGWIILSRGA